MLSKTKPPRLFSRYWLLRSAFFLIAGFFFAFPSTTQAASVVASISPTTINVDESATVTWSSVGATHCTNIYIAGTLPAAGSRPISFRSAGTYTITIGCFDPITGSWDAGPALDLTVIEKPPIDPPGDDPPRFPPMSVTVDRTLVTEPGGGMVNFNWNMADADICGYTIYRAGYPPDSHPSRDWNNERFIQEETTFRFECGYTGDAMGPPVFITIRYAAAGICNVTTRTTWSQAGRSCFSDWTGSVGSEGKTVYNDPVANPGLSGSALVRCDAGSISVQNPVCEVGFLCTGPEPHLFTGGGGTVEVYPGEEVAPTDGVRWQYSATNTSRACEFHCGSGSEWRPSGADSTFRCVPVSDGGGGSGSSIGFYVDNNRPKVGERVTLRWSATGIPDGGGCDRRSVPNSPLVGWEGRMEKDELERGGSVTFLPTNVAGENQVGTYTYSLCTSSVTVQVHDPPVITKFEAKPSAIDPGNSSMLEWEATGNVGGGCYLFNESVMVNPHAGPIGIPTFVTVSGSRPAMTDDIRIWSGTGGANSKSVSPTTTRDYTLICLSSGYNTAAGTGIAGRNVRLTVNGTLPPDDPGDGGGGGGIDLTCSSPNSCNPSCPTTKRVGLCSSGIYCCAPVSMGLPPVLTSPFTFGNPVAFSTLDGNDGLFARILTFLQGFIVLLALIFIVIGGFLYITSAGDDNRMETAKKCILAALIGLALGIAAPAFLREIASILNWGGVNPPAGVGTSLTLIEIASRVLSFLLTIIGILAIIMLVIGGIMYLTAAGDEDQIDRGKKIVKYSLIGITVALAALVLVRQLAAFFG